MKKWCFAFLLLLFAQSIIAQDYYVYVTAESEDEVSVVKFNGKKAETVKTIPVGVWPAENEGPHGITVSPDGKFSIEFAECLASCGTGPVCMFNDDFHEDVKPAEAAKLVEEYRSKS